ncbi:hypothetical protein [Streptomyces sp. NPDC008150]|uniref:hypothetical protein n=1 Tax=Streptomyces sp. NPDC008150 TaxID=3364816 RepID=UPI0036F048DF
MGINQADAAARALRMLDHPDMRIPGRRPSDGIRTTGSTPAAPLDISLVDYLSTQVDEMIEHTRAAVDTTTPVPARPHQVYDWALKNTEGASHAVQVERDILIERQGLEHAIRLGDINVVRRHPCPACGSWSLMWDTSSTKARCTDRGCKDDRGLASTWTLGRLAAQKIRGTEIWRRNAT